MPSLQGRTNLQSEGDQVCVGQVVLIVDPQVPRALWRRGGRTVKDKTHVQPVAVMQLLKISGGHQGTESGRVSRETFGDGCVIKSCRLRPNSATYWCRELQLKRAPEQAGATLPTQNQQQIRQPKTLMNFDPRSSKVTVL